MASSTPLVSIIIPTRNRKELLLYAVRSALAQSYPHIQVVVHDNNSSDGTEEHLRENIMDSRLEFHRVREDLGMTDNWNRAFSLVRGEYFLRLDDDNVIANDLIESALAEIRTHALQAVNFSQFILQLNGRMQKLFDTDNTTSIVNKFQLLYLEYFALLDSNYTLYQTTMVRTLFPEGNCYQTTLPDRYMGYRIAERMNSAHISFGVCPVPKGITRFDYRPVVATDFALKYVDYTKINPTEIFSLRDCQFNFAMHRTGTLSYFLSQTQDQELQDYANHALLSPELYPTMMRLGHACMGGTLRSFKEIPAFVKYLTLSLFDLIRFPRARMEARGVLANLDSLWKNGVLIVSRYVRSVFSGPGHVTDVAIDTRIGAGLSEQIIAGNMGSIQVDHSDFGSLKTVLKNADELKRHMASVVS